MQGKDSSTNGQQRKTITPTLYIGIGGTGLEVLKKLKKINEHIYGTDLSPVGYLSIDTRDNTEKLAPLESTEQLDITTVQAVRDAGNVLQNLEHHYPHINEWMPSPDAWGKFRNVNQVTEGADQCRALGRLLFNLAVRQKIIPFIHSAIGNIKDVDASTMTAEMGIGVNTNGLDLFIVGSICGGTGSGMFLDLAYLCRYIGMQKNYSSMKVHGVIALPNLFPTTDVSNKRANNANAYASLKELNYYTDTKKYTMPYEGINHTFTGTPPFDLCFLLNGPNAMGIDFGTGPSAFDNAISMIAEGIFGLSTSPLESPFAEYLTNKSSKKTLMTRNNVGTTYPREFCSFGVASLAFPRQRHMEYCVNLRITDAISVMLQHGETDIATDVNGFLDNIGIGSNLRNKLTKQIDTNLNAWLIDSSAQIINEDNEIRCKDDELIELLKETKTGLDAKLSATQKIIDRGRVQSTPEHNDIAAFFKDRVNNQHKSGQISGVLELVKGCSRRINELIMANEEHLEEKNKEIKQNRREYERHISSYTDEAGRPLSEIVKLADQSLIKDMFDWDKKEVLGRLAYDCLRTMQTYGRSSIEAGLNRAMIQLYKEVNGHLEKIKSRLQDIKQAAKAAKEHFKEECRKSSAVPTVEKGLKYNVLLKGKEGSAKELYQKFFPSNRDSLSGTLDVLFRDIAPYDWNGINNISVYAKKKISTKIKEEFDSKGLNVLTELKRSGKAENFISSNLMPGSASYITTDTIMDKDSNALNMLTIPEDKVIATQKSYLKEIAKIIKSNNDYDIILRLKEPYTISFMTTKLFFPLCSITGIKAWKLDCDMIRNSGDNPCYSMRDDIIAAMKDITPDAKESLSLTKRVVHTFDLSCQLGFLCKKPKGRVYYYCLTAHDMSTGRTIGGSRGGRKATKAWLMDEKNRETLEKLEKKIEAALREKTTSELNNFITQWEVFVNKGIKKSENDQTWQTEGEPDYTEGSPLPEILTKIKEQKG